MKPIIVHISNDYPDPLQPDKTKAILNLVEATPEYRHVVYSLNRVNGLGGIAHFPFGEDRTAIAYGALPKGLFWEKRLDAVAAWIAADLKKKCIVPDIVEAHKITVEGLIGQKLAAEYGCPLVCDIQGGTDTKILRLKTGLRGRYRDIAKTAALMFPYAPWSIAPFEHLIGLDRSKCHCLPVLPGFDAMAPSTPAASPRLITLLRFSGWKNKNTLGIVKAMSKLRCQYPTLTLDIYGGGEADSFLHLGKLIEKTGMSDRVTFKGSIANDQLPQLMGAYSAMVLPSFSETYGLVFAEALFRGVPVLFSKGRGIDGYFNPESIGYACNPASVDDIAAGIDHLLKNEASLKRGIAKMQATGEMDFIRRAGIIALYREKMGQLCLHKRHMLRTG